MDGGWRSSPLKHKLAEIHCRTIYTYFELFICTPATERNKRLPSEKSEAAVILEWHWKSRVDLNQTFLQLVCGWKHTQGFFVCFFVKIRSGVRCQKASTWTSVQNGHMMLWTFGFQANQNVRWFSKAIKAGELSHWLDCFSSAPSLLIGPKIRGIGGVKSTHDFNFHKSNKSHELN